MRGYPITFHDIIVQGLIVPRHEIPIHSTHDEYLRRMRHLDIWERDCVDTICTAIHLQIEVNKMNKNKNTTLPEQSQNPIEKSIPLTHKHMTAHFPGWVLVFQIGGIKRLL